MGSVTMRMKFEECEIDLQFRLATNGVIVNTLIDGRPLITTSAGTFNQ